MRYFVDMDGTLAVYPQEEGRWWERPGIFAEMEPQEKVIEAVKRIMEAGHEVYTLSAYNREFPGTVDEKNYWLDKYLPELSYDNRIYTLVGDKKTDYVPGGVTENDVLLDDYNENLEAWAEAGGIGVKLLNGINHPETWDGVSVQGHGSIKHIAEALFEIDGILEDRELEQLQQHSKNKNKNKGVEL